MAEKKLVTSTTEENGIVFDDGRIESLAEFLPPEELYLDLIARVRKYHPSDDISLIEKAYEVAGSAHANQMRKSCLLYTSPSPRDGSRSRMPSSA